MLSLTINKLSIFVNTNSGLFSTKIDFKKGLNIIRAENSSGKSTCINAIAYALGLEAILGPSRKRPFPKSLYEVIYNNKAEKESYYVKSSHVYLSISNQDGTIAELRRDIQGKSDKISVTNNGKTQDYFLGVGSGVGSAMSERGFHHWLANFIGWKLPTVPKFDGSESTLYLECIFPLFFIEQKRGWSEIQANIPSQWGIKNVKTSALEYCLGIDNFDYEKKIDHIKNIIKDLELEWDRLISNVVDISDYNNIYSSKLKDLDKNGYYPVDFYYPEGDSKINIDDLSRSLKKYLKQLDDSLSNTPIDNQSIISQSSLIRTIHRNIDDKIKELELKNVSILDIDKKLLILNNDYSQYSQLKRLKQVGSEFSIDTNKCPICDNNLYDTLGKIDENQKPMSIEENVIFIKNQIDFFTSIKDSIIKSSNQLQRDINILRGTLSEESYKLANLQNDIDDVDGSRKSIIRDKIETEIKIREIEKIQTSRDRINTRAASIYKTWLDESERLNKTKKNKGGTNKNSIIDRLEKIIHRNLESFNFNSGSVYTINISKQTLRPEQEGYDIVAETSASDYIRIMWSYTLALLELAANDRQIKHGGFVVFDEPRQHEASKISFTNLINKGNESASYNGQVIFATSSDLDELSIACDKKDVNLISFDDYVLQLESPENQIKIL